MNVIKNIKINELLNDTNHYINKLLSVDEQWLDEVLINSKSELTNFYEKICQQYSVDNKWVLMVNPQLQSLFDLTGKDTIDAKKVLRINANKVNINIENIQSTLIKGNCAAVVLPENLLSNEQVKSLTKSAQRGRTQCIIIKNNILH